MLLQDRPRFVLLALISVGLYGCLLGAPSSLLAVGAEAAAPEQGASEQEVYERILHLASELHNVSVGLDLPGQETHMLKRLEEARRDLRSLAQLTCPAGFCAERLENKRRHLLALVEVIEQGERLGTPGLSSPSAAPSSRAVASPVCSQAPVLTLGQRVLGSDGQSTWLRFKAPHDGHFIASTVGSEGDSRLAVYGACGGVMINESDDDAPGLAARLGFQASEGQSLWLEVSGLGARPVLQVTGGGSGSISGSVRDSSGDPIASIRLRARTLSGPSYFGSVFSQNDGSFQFTGVPAGTFVVLTDFFDSVWTHAAWDGILCGPSSCDISEATPIAVADGEAVTGIDLTLRRGAEITGRVRVAGSLDPVVTAEVLAYNATGQIIDSTFSDFTGRYRLQGLPEGDLFVGVRHGELGGQMWPDQSCDGFCDPFTGEAVSAAYDQQVTGIDFRLEPRGAIELSLTNAVTGTVAFPDDLRVYDTEGQLVASSFNDRIGGLASGTYYLKLESRSFLDIMWPDVPCDPSCDPLTGDPLTVVEGETLHLVGELQPNGEISGDFTDNSGGPMTGRVFVYTLDGVFVEDEFLFDDIDYRIDWIAPGSYRLYAESNEALSEAWDDKACDADCSSVGDPVVVEPGGVTRDIDFALTTLGSISGQVTDQATGQGVPGVRVRLYDDGGVFEGSRTSDSDGLYGFTGLQPGDYYLHTESAAWSDELWDDLPCPDGCDPTTGTAVTVVVENETADIDFALNRLPWIEGTVSEQGSGEILFGVRVSIYDSTGQFVDSERTDGGSFEFVGLEAGTYYAVAEGNEEHVHVLWQSQACFRGPLNGGCEVLDGDAIVVDSSGAVLDFVLPLGGTIEGTISRADGGSQTPGSSVYIFDDGGQTLAFEFVDQDGHWKAVGLGTGQYFATTSSFGYFDQLWTGLPCEDPAGVFPYCDPTAGAPIAVTLGEAVTGVDFALEELGRISGSVRSTTGEPTEFGLIQVFDAAGELVRSDSVGSSSGSNFYLDRLLAGTYFLKAAEFDFHVDQIIGGANCQPGPCDPTEGTPIEVALNQLVGPLEIVIEPGPGLEVTLRSVTGSPVPAASVDVWRTDGTWVRALITGPDGRATIGLGAGDYLLSTDNGLGLVDQLWPDISCPQGPAFLGLCDLSAASVVEVRAPNVTAVEFVLDDPGAIFFDSFESSSTSAWSLQVP